MNSDPFYHYDDEDDEPYSFYEGSCTACERYAPLGDLMLCEGCGQMLERDFMRQREWDHAAIAFGLTLEGREEARRLIIQEYGEELELLSSNSKRGKRKKRK